MRQKIFDFDSVTPPPRFAPSNERYNRLVAILSGYKPLYDDDECLGIGRPAGSIPWGQSFEIALIPANLHSSYRRSVITEAVEFYDEVRVRQLVRIPTDVRGLMVRIEILDSDLPVLIPQSP